MGYNNDLKKERQLMDKPVKNKTEASKIFKNEGDDFLKNKIMKKQFIHMKKVYYNFFIVLVMI